MQGLRNIGVATAMLVAAGAADGRPTLTVTMPGDAAVDGCLLRLLSWPAGEDWPHDVLTRRVRAAEVVGLPLPPGDYGVEVVGTSDAAVVLLRRTQIRLDADTCVSLAALAVPVDVRVDGRSVPPARLAVRRLGVGTTGDRPGPTTGPTTGPASVPSRLLLTPGETYTVACRAETPTAVLALWRPYTPEAGRPLQLSDRDATRTVKVDVAKNTPPLARLSAAFAFPDDVVTLRDAGRGQKLLTNRDRAVVSYRLETAAGQTLQFEPAGLRLLPRTVITAGGTLTPAVSAFAVKRRVAGGPWPVLLACRVGVRDENGAWVDRRKSDFAFSCLLTYGGRSFDADAVPDVAIDGNAFRPAAVRAAVAFQYGNETVRQSLTAFGVTAVASRHFETKVPLMLRGRTEAFLGMMERVREIDQSLCGRPGPKGVTVAWNLVPHTASAMIGPADGGTSLWADFPLAALERSTDPFEEPDFNGNGDAFIAHELLHTFGYGHGEAMSSLELRAEDVYRRDRWRAVDSGDWPMWPGGAGRR